jgi:uncharacterized membrane protein
VRVGRVLFGSLFIVGGVAHFVFTRAYASAVPDYLPAPRELVLISGAAEIAGGVGVLLPQTRRLAASGLVILLISIFPANVFMAQHPDRFGLPRWLLWARLPLQIPLIYWGFLYTRKRLQ